MDCYGLRSHIQVLLLNVHYMKETGFRFLTLLALRKLVVALIFVGDVISMAHSIQLTSYQPLLGLKFVAYFPNLLERILMWTFHVSLALTLLNGFPVYFLDGESILEATLSHFTSLSPRKRKKVLSLCLLAGFLISIIGFFQELFRFCLVVE